MRLFPTSDGCSPDTRRIFLGFSDGLEAIFSHVFMDHMLSSYSTGAKFVTSEAAELYNFQIAFRKKSRVQAKYLTVPEWVGKDLTFNVMFMWA